MRACIAHATPPPSRTSPVLLPPPAGAGQRSATHLVDAFPSECVALESLSASPPAQLRARAPDLGGYDCPYLSGAPAHAPHDDSRRHARLGRGSGWGSSHEKTTAIAGKIKDSRPAEGLGSGIAKSRRSRPSPDVAPRSYVQVCLEVPSVASRHCMIFQRLLRGSFGNLEAIHDSSLGCLEDHAGASRQTSTYESVPRLDMRERLDLARSLPRLVVEPV